MFEDNRGEQTFYTKIAERKKNANNKYLPKNCNTLLKPL